MCHLKKRDKKSRNLIGLDEQRNKVVKLINYRLLKNKNSVIRPRAEFKWLWEKVTTNSNIFNCPIVCMAGLRLSNRRHNILNWETFPMV